MFEIGSKAKNLFLLNKKGFLIPEFFIISSNFLEDNDYNCVKDLILKKTKNWEGKIILRSSASCEDGNKDSFAGIFESKVIGSPKEIFLALKNILEYKNNQKFKDYISLKNISKKVCLSIIVQKYILGDVSGVVFNQKKEYIINSRKGSATSVVGGEDCDEYVISKEEKKVRNTHHLEKSLNLYQIKKIISLVDKVSHFFNFNQDVEWTIKDEKVYLLQCRPITKEIIEKKLTVWDNSNISESYSGIVLYLTYSFAKRVYSQVYEKVAIASGVSEKKLKNFKAVFDNLLGIFYGRFYYNMENWYRMLTLFPGYENNKINFDRMISAKTKSDLEKEHKSNVGILFKSKYYLLILFKYLFFNLSIKKFKRKIFFLFRKFDEIRLEKLSKKELLERFFFLEKNFISVWHIPIENDFLVMTFNGLLVKEGKKIGLSEEETLSFLSGFSKLNTSNQIKDLIFLSKNKSKKNIRNYFKKYGGRFANELKLESEELTEDSEEFNSLLEIYSKADFKEPQKQNKIPFGFLGKVFLRETKKYLIQREELRILRAKVFGLARKIFLRIGEIMEKQKSIDSYKDIFYLNLEEIQNESLNHELRKIISKRKIDYKKYSSIEVENMLYTDESGKIVRDNNKKRELSNSNSFFGRPCSPGEIYSKADLIKNSSPKLDRKYGIIVTESADPGWAPVLGLCKGIILERGGILSHISILARELNIPCIINVPGITKKVKKGEYIYMNGKTGEIKIGRNN